VLPQPVLTHLYLIYTSRWKEAWIRSPLVKANRTNKPIRPNAHLLAPPRKYRDWLSILGLGRVFQTATEVFATVGRQ